MFILHVHVYYIILFLAVTYAAYLGSQGLDAEDTMTRIQVFQVAKACNEDEAQPLADHTVPFIPELSYYRVFSVHKGRALLH